MANLSICLSNRRSTTVSLESSPFSELVSQSVSQSVSQPVSRSASLSVSQPVTQSSSQPLQADSQPVIQSASQSVSQQFSQSASQPVSQPVIQSVSQFFRVGKVRSRRNRLASKRVTSSPGPSPLLKWRGARQGCQKYSKNCGVFCHVTHDEKSVFGGCLFSCSLKALLNH